MRGKGGGWKREEVRSRIGRGKNKRGGKPKVSEVKLVRVEKEVGGKVREEVRLRFGRGKKKGERVNSEKKKKESEGE